MIFNLKMKSVFEEIYESSNHKLKDEPTNDIIFKFVRKNKSDMNENILSCIVPILLQQKDPYEGVVNLFTDY